MRFLAAMFGRTLSAKGIPQLTDYLASNPMFRNLVINFHNTKSQAFEDLDSYLEKELLDKKHRKKGPAGHIDS